MGPLMEGGGGGAKYHMSILRNAHASFHYFCNFKVGVRKVQLCTSYYENTCHIFFVFLVIWLYVAC